MVSEMTGPCEQCGRWPTPKLTVDAVVEKDGQILLIQRGIEPFKGMLALPGGFVSEGEDPQDAVLRELKEECGLEGRIIDLMCIKGKPGRDPRGHIVTIVYLVEAEGDPIAGDDAAHAAWYDLSEISEPLAGDHSEVLDDLRQLLTGIGPL